MNLKHMLTQIALATSLTVPVIASADKGEQLYNKDCQGCHGTEVFTRPDRKVKDLAGLSKRVRQCSYATEKKWFNEDIDAVVSYLNNSFYKF
jgi:cytochrome c5